MGRIVMGRTMMGRAAMGRAAMQKQEQRGITLLGFLVVLLVVGFCLTVAFRLGPLYLDDYTVAESFAALGDDVRTLSDQGIRAKLYKNFVVNNVDDIDLKAVKIERSSEKILVSLSYERRVALIGNLDAVAKFQHVYDSSRN